jgi:HPt (histidine-containing phosphotransfer) domain-containing protein
MLIYNYQKEFLGIYESDLKALGFSDLSQLRSESADFADLFVKTPGFVHNFKHVHWIDFVTCADGNEDSKVIIHANGKNFRCTLDIKTAYLVDNPTQKAYLINLLNLRTLTHNENEQVAGDVLEKPAPRVSTENSAIFNDSEFNTNSIQTEETFEEEQAVTADPYETNKSETLDKINSNVVEDIYEAAPIEIDDIVEYAPIEIDFEEELVEVQSSKTQEPILDSNAETDYIYDPHFASDELGLPVDLIEEFIQDFINQALEFKGELYKSLEEGNSDNIKILSHKLKGVAANLRVEDAFEVLSTINTSDDEAEIQTNMDTLYVIIDKLSGKSITKTSVVKKIAVAEETPEDNADDLVLSFKDNDEVINDSEVPQKIEMPELADDDFEAFEEKIEIPQELEIELDIEDSSSSYNKAFAANELGISKGNFDTLFEDYITESENSCNKINQAIEDNDSRLWKATAIKLKGMSDNMRIHDFTQELESIIHTQDSVEAKDLMNSICASLEKLSNFEV